MQTAESESTPRAGSPSVSIVFIKVAGAAATGESLQVQPVEHGQHDVFRRSEAQCPCAVIEWAHAATYHLVWRGFVVVLDSVLPLYQGASNMKGETEGTGVTPSKLQLARLSRSLSMLEIRR